MLLTVIFLGSIIILLYIYFRGKYNKHYWNKRGVAFYDKYSTGGPFWQFVTEDRSFFQILKDIYNDYQDVPAVGLGSLFDHALYVKDPVNMQHISQVEFQSFYHRGIPINDHDILGKNLVWLNGPSWKLIRQKLTPLFTVAKLKKMYYIIDKSGQDFVDFLKENPDRLKGDAYDTLSHFCSASVAAAVFGIGTKSTFDSPFRQRVRVALAATPIFNMKFAVGGVSSSLYKVLGFNLFPDHEDFFVNAINQVIKQREKEGTKRHDFVDVCVELQKNGTMIDSETGFALEPTDEVLAAQAFIFFLAGIEPSTSALVGTLLELGRHPNALQRVQEEVDAAFKKYNDQLTYDALNEVEYLDRVLSECLRLHPPFGYLSRQCTKDSVLPVGNILVEKGVKIITPIFELHHDPKYFPNPEVFDPDRFLREGEINDTTYLPFGRGNRYCIGARFARIQLLSGLMHFLKHYTPQSYVQKGGIQYSKEQNQVKLKNIQIEFVPRNK